MKKPNIGDILLLTFNNLRAANVKRCESVFHKLNDWSPTDWATCVGGESGECLNFVKKLRRLDGADKHKDNPKARAKLIKNIGKELADVVIYADLLAARLGLDLGEEVIKKFNEVSKKRKSNIKL